MLSNVVDGKKARNWQNLQVIGPVQANRLSTQLMSHSSATTSDYELTQAIAQGTISGIGDLYERHRTKVYSLCLRMTGNVSEAEDLTQEIFLHLLRKAGSFRGESQFSTWLYRFTTNHVLMHFRTRSRRNQRFPYLLDEVEATRVMKTSLGPQLLDRVALDVAVAKLPFGCRSVFMKVDVEGYNHQEVAGLFGCSVGNSKSQLHKARRRLRKLLNSTKTCAHQAAGSHRSRNSQVRSCCFQEL